MSYYNKYIEYKNKYLKLKNQIGGNNITINVRNNDETKQHNISINTSIKEIIISDKQLIIICKNEKPIILTDDCVLAEEHNNVTIHISSNFQKFIDAQVKGTSGSTYNQAMKELKDGMKTGHWIWYCLPNIIRPNTSPKSTHFAIKDFYEAIYYICNDILRKRLLDMLKIILTKLKEGVHIKTLMNSHIDVNKLKSCVTLFYHVFNYTKDNELSLLNDLYKITGEDDFTYNMINKFL